MAQGEDAFKKRLVLDNTDIIPTLLSISLLSTNEHLQSCCASSVSLALRYSLHQSNSSSGHNVGNNIGGNIAGTANTSAKSTHSKFMVKVMRDVDMDLCTTVFRESTSKLKQAYLNIINLVLMQTSNTKTSNAKRRDVDTEKTLVALPDSIQSLVSKFVHHSSLHRSILKLLDQTSSTIIRGKALLCIQLLCRNKPELLLNFVDSRLPIILHKTVETVMSWSNDPPIRSTSHTGPVSQPVKSALSLLYFLKTSAKVSAMLVMKSLDFLIKNNGNVDGRSASDSGLINASKVCSAVVAIVSIHPLLKKLVFCSSESSSFIQSVNTSLRIINTSSLSWVPSTVMLYVSQSLYESFELISFLPDMAQPESWPLSIKRNVDQSSLSPVAILLSSAGLLSTNQTYITHVHSLLLHHLPTLALLLYNRDGNIRVLAVTSARKLIPELISTFRNLRCRSDFILHNDFDVYLNDPTCILSILLPSIPALLMDQAPIPQYTIKLLLDTLTVADSAIGSVINKLYESNVLSSLVNLLNPTVRTQVPTQLRGSTSGSALETGLISASASRESLHSLGSQKSNDCQLSLSLSTDSNLLSLVHLIFEYLSTSLDDDNEHSRHLANKMIEYKIVKYLSRSLMALLSTQLSDHLRMTGISSDMTTDHHYSSSDAASTITSISAAHPVVELLYTVLVYGYGIVEDTRNALSSCTQSTEFSMIKSRLQNQLGMFDACADCFIPMFQLLFIIIRLYIESSISGDEYTLSTDFDMKGSFVATISSLDLIFQLFPDKGTYALLNTVSDSSEQYDQISRDISVAYQFKYMLGIKVIELINPVVTVKLLTLLSHITKVS